MGEPRYIVPLTGDLRYGRELLGGKGYHLQRLAHANFHVPGGFVITTLAFREVLQELAARTPVLQAIEDFGSLVAGASLPPDLSNEILRAARTLRVLTGRALVVRSSATTEDHEESSMAGQAASFVNIVTEQQLLDAVRGCWASLFTRESITYRSRTTGVGESPEMAVVVQQLVPAHRAGVLFTLDPVTRDTSRFVVSASWGLGETVVSGRAADTVMVDRESGAILSQEVVAKRERRVPAREGGMAVVPVTRDAVLAPVVDPPCARRLRAIGVRAEEVFAAPQDLEWAEWDGRIYLLQTRPITASGSVRRRSVWTNTNVGEALPGVGTPFTWSFIRSFSRKGLVHAFRGLGCTVPERYTIVGNIRGRVYLNISEFMSVASQIPFVTPDILQRLAGGGGAEAMAGTWDRLPRARFLARFPWTIVTTLLSRTITPARVALWSQRFRQFSRSFAETRFVALGRKELAALWQRTDAIFEETGTLMLECSGEFLMSYMVISLVLRGLLGEQAGKMERELFSGLSGVRSAEPGLDLLRMARRVQTMPALAELLQAVPTGQLLEELTSGGSEARSLASALEAFLRSHGHRAAREAELSEPRWREDPTFPLAMLVKYVGTPNLADPDALQDRRKAQREEATAHLVEELPRAGRPLFLRLLQQSQEGARVREEMRNAVVHTLGFYRRLALETGRRMAEAGLLPAADEVFFLTADECRHWVAGEEDSTRLPLRAAMRRMEFEALSALPELPQWFVMEGERIVSSQPPVDAARTVAGLAGSSGTATGRVRIIRSPDEQGRLQAGDILVAPFTDVGWTPLFLVAGAVVTELGGPLSHSCVVAREYGVPAVVNVAEATRILTEGSLVTVDGDRGLVLLQDESR